MGCAGCVGGPVLVVCCWLCWWSAAAFLCFLFYALVLSVFAGGGCATGSGAEIGTLACQIGSWKALEGSWKAPGGSTLAREGCGGC